MRLVNSMEALVEAQFEKVAKRFPDACLCPRCKLDVMALALNNLPPRYVVTEAGEVYARAEGLHQQYAADVTSALAQAFFKVMSSPRH